MSVAITPGAIAFTRTPKRATSRDNALVNPINPAFVASVSGLMGIAGQTNYSAAPDHAADHRPRIVERTREVRFHNLLPQCRVHVVERPVAANSGVVDQHVNRAERFLRLLDHFLRPREVPHVGLECYGPFGLLRQGRHQPVRRFAVLRIRKRDGITGSGEFPDHRLPDAAAATRYQRNFHPW